MRKYRITFVPQAWFRDQAIEVDAQGENTFEVEEDHLLGFTEDALRYELWPYADLPQVPAWIKAWTGPFYFDVHGGVWPGEEEY